MEMVLFWFFAGLGVMVAGLGIGAYFHSKGEAELIRARSKRKKANSHD